MSRRIYTVEYKPVGGWWTLLIAALLVVYSKELIIIGLFGLIFWLVFEYLKFKEDRKIVKAVNEAATKMESKPYDDIYSYETMPLTYPIGDTFPYRDFNDGLKEWK